MSRNIRTSDSIAARITEFADQSDETNETELVIPEDLTGLSEDDLNDLSTRATEAFSAVYGDGTSVSDDDLPTLETLATGIEALRGEAERRAEASTSRSETAQSLAARVGLTASADESEEDGEDDGDDDSDEVDEVDDEGSDEGDQPESVTASARKEVRVNLAGIKRKTPKREAPEPPAKPTIRDFAMAAPDVPNFANGQGMDFLDMGKAVDSRLATFPKAQFEAANRAGRHIRQQFGVAIVRKPFEDGLVIDDDAPLHVEEVLKRATDETRLPGGSLVASGGWCAPSETLYDLYDSGESRSGMLSIPEVGIRRGGLRYTTGIDFSAVYEAIGFSYTEEQDIAGQYGVDANGVGNDTEGDKPCYRVPCPEFVEERLGVTGLCITAGLLQSRGYPEVIADVVRKALIAHDHKVNSRVIGELVGGSTAITMPDQEGATAALLDGIEKQATHYRYTHLLDPNTTLEAVFPLWVHAVVRSDLARRLGVDLLDVSDERINGWFRARKISPQFVYGWQGLASTAANAFVAWPDEVTFLLYRAGTWIKGAADVITLDTIYDSVNLGQNDYTALFTEEGILTAKRGIDSRVVTVPLCANGATHSGLVLACDGTAAVVTP